MILPALSEAADRGELLLVNGGILRFHRRKDGVVTIRELLVLPDQRGQGLGRAMVECVQEMCPDAPLRARCPVGYPSNGFWEHMGFIKVATESTINVWEHLP